MVEIDGEKIKKLREDQGLTQLYMATAVEVTTDTISRWENKRYPTIKKENALKLSSALGVGLEEILLSKKTIEAQLEPQQKVESPNNSSNKKHLIFLAGAILVIGTFLILYFYFFAYSKSDIEVTRIMPKNTIPNSPFPVVVELRTVGKKSVSIILKETLPAGCIVIETSPAIGYSPSTGEIKWIQKVSGFTRFSYLVKIKGELDSEAIFSGTVSFSNSEELLKVDGNQKIRLNSHHWADSDGDNKISDQEILNVYDYFSGIDNFTVNIEKIEKMWLGSSYNWNQKQNLISISE